MSWPTFFGLVEGALGITPIALASSRTRKAV